MTDKIDSKKDESTFFPVHVSYLIPDWSAPCSVYFYYKGKFLEVIKEGSAIPIRTLLQLKLNQHFFGHIKVADRIHWEEWIKKRYCHSPDLKSTIDTVDKFVLGNIARFIQHAVDKFIFKGEAIDGVVMVEYQKRYKFYANNPLLRWFFREDLDVKMLESNARLGYLMLLFFDFAKAIADGPIADAVIYAAMIHRVKDENPKRPDIPSINIQNFLKRKNIAMPADILKILSMQDERNDGSGFPNKLTGEEIPLPVAALQIARLFNDAYGELLSGSKKEKMEKARAKVKEQEKSFDPGVMEVFNHFIEAIEFRT